MSLKTSLETKIPPPVYGLLSASLMWWLDKLFPTFSMPAENLGTLGIMIILAGLCVELLALKQFTGKHTTINPISPGKTRTIVISGLYHYTRNPMYLGMLLVLFGWGLYLSNLLSFVVLPFFVVVLTHMQILPEEHILGEKFGKTYHDYLNTVRRWI